MKFETIGIVSPGDMGHAIGRQLLRSGRDVIACLQGRSTRTHELAQQAGIRDVQSLERMAKEADLILSILVPDQAESAAAEMAAIIGSSKAKTHFVDCNAVTPQAAVRMSQTITSSGSVFTDAGIIGLPPADASNPRLYVSGPLAEQLIELDGDGIQIKLLGPEIGRASGIKMCYAAMTKGTFALQYALSIAAQRMGLLDELLSEFQYSQPAAWQQMNKALPKLPAKAHRWVGEMLQIAATLEEAGVTPKFHLGAADLYRQISSTILGQETPETIDPDRSLRETLAILARDIRLL